MIHPQTEARIAWLISEIRHQIHELERGLRPIAEYYTVDGELGEVVAQLEAAHDALQTATVAAVCDRERLDALAAENQDILA